jgi:hypothetical protein
VGTSAARPAKLLPGLTIPPGVGDATAVVHRFAVLYQ